MPQLPAGSLRLRLSVPASSAAGEPVPLGLQAENTGEEPVTLYLRGRTIAFDLVVERPDGSEVWRRLHGNLIQSILRMENLGPGQSLVLKDFWDQRSTAGESVQPGTYRVRGELLTEGEPLVSPAEHLLILPIEGRRDAEGPA